jgi:predicted AAA+ superfamily ATPase
MALDAGPDLLPRLVTPRLLAACQDTPVLLLNGPRQSGKTTLVRDLLGGDFQYLTLDDATTLRAATGDPTGFVRELDRAIVDEIQRAPALLLAIKQAVDGDRRPGRFVLTGSANILTLPTVADSLAGRMEVIDLLPLAQAEILGQSSSDFLAQAFAGQVARPGPLQTGAALVQAVLAGGYPEMRRRATPARGQAWARAYLEAIVQRDVRDIASIDKLDQLPRLLQALAQHSGQLLNLSQLGGQLGLDTKTVGKYTAVFEQLFLLHRLAPWSHHALQRLVKTPKLHFNDAGLLAAMTGLTAPMIAADRARFGPLLESFVFGELRKLMSWQEQPLRLSHYRDKDQDEVDFVLEDVHGQVVGIEVKAAATVTGRDFKGLRKLAAALGPSFQLGIVLYDGEQAVPFGERLVAAPLSCLWSTGDAGPSPGRSAH